MNKLVKSQIIIYMYDQLLTKGVLDPKEIKCTFNLENKTFQRYIAEIKAYLYNFYTGKEITYSRLDRVYYLIKYDQG